MSSEWKEGAIGEFVDLSQGLAINAKSKHLLVEKGLPLLRITDLINDTYVQFVEEENAPVKCVAIPSDVIYTRTGQVGLVFTGKTGVVHNNCFKVIPKDDSVSRKYLYWFLRQNKIIEYVNSVAAGSVQKDLNHSAFKSIPFRFPPLPEQKAIAHILGKLDDKIELNRQMNQTLEQMAQALFQSWFVDFDPVLDNAIMAGNEIPEALASKAQNRRAVLAGHGLINRHSEEGTPEESHHSTTSLATKAENRRAVPTPHGHTGRHSEEGTPKESHSITSPQGTPLILSNPLLASQFPNTFTFNETLNKWIPEGWEGGNLGDRYFVKGGYAFKSKDFIEAEGTPVVKIKNIKADKTIDNSSFSYVKTEIAQQREDFWLETGDILMAMTGATVGKFGFIVKKGEDLIVLNQRVAKFYPKLESIRSLWFIYCFFDDNRNTDFIENTAEGSAQPNISANDIMSAPMILPEEKVLSFFEKVMSEKFNRIIANQKQTETLTQLREVLLPQLISGKLKVPEALLVLEMNKNITL